MQKLLQPTQPCQLLLLHQIQLLLQLQAHWGKVSKQQNIAWQTTKGQQATQSHQL
jgi:hypothetical protein